MTEYNIKAAKFSAYEEDHLVTCGRDNVRMYRLKGGMLRGVTVRTGAPDKRVRASLGLSQKGLKILQLGHGYLLLNTHHHHRCPTAATKLFLARFHPRD